MDIDVNVQVVLAFLCRRLAPLQVLGLKKSKRGGEGERCLDCLRDQATNAKAYPTASVAAHTARQKQLPPPLPPLLQNLLKHRKNAQSGRIVSRRSHLTILPCKIRSAVAFWQMRLTAPVDFAYVHIMT